MIKGINIKLPLVYNSHEGPYETNKDIVSAINQNLYVLFMTKPGERIMNTDYGIGIKDFLFENITPYIIERIKDRIKQQVKKYISGLVLETISIKESEDIDNAVEISLRWSIPSLGVNSDFYYNFIG